MARPLLALLLLSGSRAVRHRVALDGGWTLRLAGDDDGGRPVGLPGAWSAQGFGGEIWTQKHHYAGNATYAARLPPQCLSHAVRRSPHTTTPPASNPSSP